MPDNDSSGLPPSPLSRERAGEICDGLAYKPAWDVHDDYTREDRIDELIYVVRFHEFTRSVKDQSEPNRKRKRGRPREWLIDDLVVQIGFWYVGAAGGRQKTGGRRRGFMFPTSAREGPLVRLVEELVVMLYPERAGTAIGELVRHAVRRYFRSPKIH